MPPASKQNPSPDVNNLLILVGQLMEAAKAASDGLKAVSQETQGNAKALITVSTTVELMKQRVDELSDLIRDPGNDGNLLTKSLAHANLLTRLREDVDELAKDLERTNTAIKPALEAAGHVRTATNTVWRAVEFVGWLLTFGVALYAALQ